MIDTHKRIDYWIQGAMSDIETAELLISGRKHFEGKFFCHLTKDYRYKTKALLQCLRQML